MRITLVLGSGALFRALRFSQFKNEKYSVHLVLVLNSFVVILICTVTASAHSESSTKHSYVIE